MIKQSYSRSITKRYADTSTDTLQYLNWDTNQKLLTSSATASTTGSVSTAGPEAPRGEKAVIWVPDEEKKKQEWKVQNNRYPLIHTSHTNWMWNVTHPSLHRLSTIHPVSTAGAAPPGSRRGRSSRTPSWQPASPPRSWTHRCCGPDLKCEKLLK